MPTSPSLSLSLSLSLHTHANKAVGCTIQRARRSPHVIHGYAARSHRRSVSSSLQRGVDWWRLGRRRRRSSSGGRRRLSSGISCSWLCGSRGLSRRRLHWCRCRFCRRSGCSGIGSRRSRRSGSTCLRRGRCNSWRRRRCCPIGRRRRFGRRGRRSSCRWRRGSRAGWRRQRCQDGRSQRGQYERQRRSLRRRRVVASRLDISRLEHRARGRDVAAHRALGAALHCAHHNLVAVGIGGSWCREAFFLVETGVLAVGAVAAAAADGEAREAEEVERGADVVGLSHERRGGRIVL